MSEPITRRPAALFLALAVLCLGAVGAALFTQYQWDMRPCPWCILQRVIFVAIGLLALVGAVVAAASRSRAPHAAVAVLVLLLAASGVAAALWQHFVAAASASCNLTLADKIVNGLGLDEAWPEVFAAQASCADAAVKLFGLPYEFWSLALFVVAGAGALRLLTLRPRRR